MDYYSSLDSRFLDSETPTIFEIISSQQLDNLLTPSIRYILVYYTQRYPNYLIRLLNKFDELNLVVRGAVEYQFLKNWNSSFIEKFYGLKRCNNGTYLKNHQIPLKIRESRKRLTRKQLIISLIEVVGVPYAKEKLDVYYDKIYAKYLLNNVTQAQRVFIKIYPIIKLIAQVLNFISLVSLLNGKNKSPSLLSWLFNIRVSRLNSYDYELNDPSPSSIATIKDIGARHLVRPLTPTQALFSVLSRSYKLSNNFLYFLGNKIFPVSIFLLKFLEWWNSSEFVSKLKQKAEDLQLEAPPTNDKINYRYKANGECPICDKIMTTPALLDTGYVFCYTCIHNYITNQDKARQPRCPISGELLLNCRLDSEKNWKIQCLRRLMI